MALTLCCELRSILRVNTVSWVTEPGLQEQASASSVECYSHSKVALSYRKGMTHM